DSITRLLPDVLGNKESLESESFDNEGNMDFPQYTKPEDFNGWKVPEVLLSGHHKNIKDWRNQNRI
ncbi:TPA: tRNA (guanosine(37)-N1)-methyltransferase TrmD, partial [Patescibacteria group bacterium]|nr:tRNA (guanosine(37)-N1)-methyltransferase TrmD [Patescibacteria group bacterium]